MFLLSKDLKINSTLIVSLINPNVYSGDIDTWVQKQWLLGSMSIRLVFSLICIIIGKLMQTWTITEGFSLSVQLVITRGRYSITHTGPVWIVKQSALLTNKCSKQKGG